MDPLRNSTVLVTGASSGIGRACARSFAARGARLILVARRLARLEALRDELAADGAMVRIHALDVRERSAVEAFERELTEAGVVPDVLVNNAGLARGLDEIWKGAIEDWEEMIDTNVKGLLYITR